uniref:Uncharacterized protein n=1 Tax=Gasterosteus aculeatus TaxID=69293 RepID=G3PFK2_GASAC
GGLWPPKKSALHPIFSLSLSLSLSHSSPLLSIKILSLPYVQKHTRTRTHTLLPTSQRRIGKTLIQQAHASTHTHTHAHVVRPSVRVNLGGPLCYVPSSSSSSPEQ